MRTPAESAKATASIVVGLPPEPDPPAGLAPDAVLQVQIGTINLRHHDELAAEINRLHAEHPGLAMMDDYLDEWSVAPARCPLCSRADELTLRGKWGSPATVLCPNGHIWRLAPDHPQWSARVLQLAVTQSVAEHGSLPKPLTD